MAGIKKRGVCSECARSVHTDARGMIRWHTLATEAGISRCPGTALAPCPFSADGAHALWSELMATAERLALSSVCADDAVTLGELRRLVRDNPRLLDARLGDILLAHGS